jgi:hypothetical protein
MQVSLVLALAAVALASPFYKEDFSSGWEGRWVQSKHKSDYGKFVASSGKYFGDAAEATGIETFLFSCCHLAFRFGFFGICTCFLPSIILGIVLTRFARYQDQRGCQELRPFCPLREVFQRGQEAHHPGALSLCVSRCIFCHLWHWIRSPFLCVDPWWAVFAGFCGWADKRFLLSKMAWRGVAWRRGVPLHVY